MHELSVAESILDIVKENISSNGGGRLKSVRIRVGELAGILPDSLDFCFSAITKDTPMENAVLKIERTAIMATCGKCGAESEIRNLEFVCPVCGGLNMKVVSGNELQVVEIEIGDEE